jgi:IS30 family transposase
LKQYLASQADEATWYRAHRPKPCKPTLHPGLKRLVASKLKISWSPKQIDGWLKRQYPFDENKHVSYETIYRSLFIQGRRVLKKEFQLWLRTQGAIRRSKHHSIKHEGLGKI